MDPRSPPTVLGWRQQHPSVTPGWTGACLISLSPGHLGSQILYPPPLIKDLAQGALPWARVTLQQNDGPSSGSGPGSRVSEASLVHSMTQKRPMCRGNLIGLLVSWPVTGLWTVLIEHADGAPPPTQAAGSQGHCLGAHPHQGSRSQGARDSQEGPQIQCQLWSPAGLRLIRR